MVRRHIQVGRWGEDIAAAALEINGYTIIERNWRPEPIEGIETVRGEVDLVVLDPELNLVFVEVKTRSTADYGHPLEAINRTKSQRLKFLAYSWCSTRETTDFTGLRIDAVAITGTPKEFTFDHRKAV
ncbi:YraN family protein [Rothia sp. ZJ932]|uniref:YraN family protein n=1 Tax=Rothia sp. ZJ932 TaxID=2810516 RepID=UPI0019678B86|nr:YraN family protein [Rothia sp. ZJ932]QRZ62358.1 YraN family protein [Rothia sp. ZJ932]